jgi:hypothetical protein
MVFMEGALHVIDEPDGVRTFVRNGLHGCFVCEQWFSRDQMTPFEGFLICLACETEASRQGPHSELLAYARSRPDKCSFCYRKKSHVDDLAFNGECAICDICMVDLVSLMNSGRERRGLPPLGTRGGGEGEQLADLEPDLLGHGEA